MKKGRQDRIAETLTYNFCFGVHSRAFRRAGENSSACGKKILGGIGEPSAF